MTPRGRARRGLCSLLCLAALQCAPVGAGKGATAAPTPATAPASDADVRGEPSDRQEASGAAASDADDTSPSPMAEPKFDFDAMLTREREPLPLAPVVDPRGRWRGTLEARRKPIVVDKGSHVSIVANVGTKSELRCEAHDGQLNPGAAIAKLLGAAAGSIQLEEAAVYHVASAGGSPVLFVRARYVTRATPPLAGELKVAVSPGAMLSLLCMHDEPGYRQSFVRHVEGLVASIERAEPVRSPQYSALWRFAVGEAQTGYRWERLFMESDGGVSSYTFDVMMAQLASGELRIRDYMAAEVHDRSGVTRGNYLSYRGTTKAYEIELQRGRSGAYGYTGDVEGKAVDGRFTPEGPLASNYEVLLRLQGARLGSGPTRFRLDEYRPRRDPTRTQSVEYVLDAATSSLARREGSNTDTWSIDDGLPSGSRVTDGPNTFVGTLVAQHSVLGSEPGVTRGARPAPEATAPFPLAERRRGFETHVFAETDHTPAKAPPAGVFSKVTYPAPLGANVAYVTPARAGAKRPAVVWIGAGLDWSIGDGAWRPAPRAKDVSARAFREAGLVLMLPALRGSNENPGRNECFLGEVDDLIAAASYLAAREDVDAERVYLAGHATGATLALLAAASTDRFRAVFAFGPVADARQYGTPSGGGCLPADAAPEELELRAPLHFLSSIRTPTFVFEGGQGGNADVFDTLRARASESVHFAIIPGFDATGVVAPGTEAIARAIVAGQVDDAHLVISAKPAGAKASAAR